MLLLDDNLGSAGRAFCECDLAFVTEVDGKSTPNTNFDTTQCIPHNGGGNGQCCQSSGGLYSWFNSQYYECCSGNVAPIGSC